MGHAQFTPSNTVTVAQLAGFDEIIDVRTPAEFAADHIPGAVNHPVLNNEERARVGKLYQQNRFEARRLGAALIAANMSRHLQSFAYPARWRPLVYCWRGGKRSAAMAVVLREIGWNAHRLQGGYKAYRRLVISELETLPACFRYRVICGPTGSGKSRLLATIREAGGQVLDLEGLAKHRGSVLGNFPGEAQPSQKMFESALWAALRKLQPDLPVFVEAESKKIGTLSIPGALMQCVWRSECIVIDTSLTCRFDFLQAEYRHFFETPALLKDRLEALIPLHGKETVARWQAAAEPAQWKALVTELLQKHYDPAYQKSTVKNFLRYAAGQRFELDAADDVTLRKLALELISTSDASLAR
jgi:tRNA 2-selenouridine synthase